MECIQICSWQLELPPWCVMVSCCCFALEIIKKLLAKTRWLCQDLGESLERCTAMRSWLGHLDVGCMRSFLHVHVLIVHMKLCSVHPERPRRVRAARSPHTCLAHPSAVSGAQFCPRGSIAQGAPTQGVIPQECHSCGGLTSGWEQFG